MNLTMLLPLLLIIVAMFAMTRSAKKKQQQASEMRNQMQAGSGVRTIGGMYATVKEVHEETVLLEVAPGVHAIYAKNAVGVVLADEEYNRIIDGAEPQPIVPDDASSLTSLEKAEAPAEDESRPADLTKAAPAEDKADEKAEEKADETAAPAEAEAGAKETAAEKKAGDSDTK
ncbi:preprotein translocase subunit YajC [Streptomyces sp. NPDC059740]|uniref:preprotein translocase subunit YajC n=1 Tax=Streptomyces sp. NPDC059740 TaxID=3346926 RepID=UPI00365D7636